ncbi:hypothetical protein KZO01_22060 [Kurthia zopfii]|uniref:3-oxosteroid 1-dehydrogenase n=1 Tax=Kurthia zopfii TaxID=1650 RepID=A0A8B4Q9X7_9BACL|nr:FAD-dependent oxidoreductase [Kurthia zopfii]TDR33944.1 FAD binding domain-containing protein [Kurthia zopfii]GEK31897.1 hypothetical protein KZO01_22060 [Kurthia zopfii]STX09492.1 3-oxosteroid 1-dehydrogenase [Kurthia zopfii]
MSNFIPEKWDLETDVVVLGTGGAALVAAVTAAEEGAKVIALEKTHQIGGTTAFSGGVTWIPVNRYMKDAGIEDSEEAAIKYIERLSQGRGESPMIKRFVEKGHEMIDFLYEKTPTHFKMPAAYPEYYAHLEEALKINISEWNEPESVIFALKGMSDNFKGGGHFKAHTIDDNNTTMEGHLDITAGGAMGPMVNTILKNFVPKTAEELTANIVNKLIEINK